MPRVWGSFVPLSSPWPFPKTFSGRPYEETWPEFNWKKMPPVASIRDRHKILQRAKFQSQKQFFVRGLHIHVWRIVYVYAHIVFVVIARDTCGWHGILPSQFVRLPSPSNSYREYRQTPPLHSQSPTWQYLNRFHRSRWKQKTIGTSAEQGDTAIMAISSIPQSSDLCLWHRWVHLFIHFRVFSGRQMLNIIAKYCSQEHMVFRGWVPVFVWGLKDFIDDKTLHPGNDSFA